MESKIKSANWHLTNRCNYACRFCFAQNLGKKELSSEEGKILLRKLADVGIEKINFAGGEPLLHPHLAEYCREAKNLGMTVSIVTNGSKLNRTMIESLKNCVDWIGISVDSSSDAVEAELGRGRGDHVSQAIIAAYLVHAAGIKLKVNTTVTSLTWEENMLPLIRVLNPDRWKVMQMMTIAGENDNDQAKGLVVTNGQFRYFIERHRSICLQSGDYPVFESADDIEDSYFIITPDGHVKSDKGKVIKLYNLGDILSGGIDKFINADKYSARGGIYNWKSNKTSVDFNPGDCL